MDFFEDRHAQKLYIARDAKGDANYHIFEVARLLDEKFKENKNFIGTAPYGSSVRGYSKKGVSDLDEIVLVDAPSKIELEKIIDEVITYCDEVGAEKSFVVSPLFTNVNIKLLTEGLSKPEKSNEYIVAVCAIADLCNAAKGERVREYQNNVIDYINSLDNDTVNGILDFGSTYLGKRDAAHIDRINERLNTNMTSEKYLTQRKTSWQKRLKKVLQLNNIN